jgi:hypothetical protein
MSYFEYCTVQDLRNEGVTPEEATDEHLLMRIKIASAKINAFTGQYFAPSTDDQYVDGQNSRTVWLPEYVPIQKLSAISIEATRTARGAYPKVLPDRRYWVVDTSKVQLSRGKRVIEWIYDIEAPEQYGTSFLSYNSDQYETWFPEGRQNVKIEGVFGWLENSKDVESSVVGDFTAGESKIVIDDAASWEVGDYCIFPDGSMQIVTGVTQSANELIFQGDPYKLREDVSDGEIVTTYGRAPLLIRWCTIKLVNNASGKLGDSSTWDDIIARAIVSEKTDNYQYKLDASLLRDQIEASSGSTGDAEVDAILQQLIDEIPAYIGFV